LKEGSVKMDQIKGYYHVIFKYPKQTNERIKSQIQAKVSQFDGSCENFTGNGKCVFRNDKDELLLVDYDDIVQMFSIED
jgi:hypothetical protein